MYWGKVFPVCSVRHPAERRKDPWVCRQRQVGPHALLCLSCLAVPYDPIEVKPLCQKEISGGHCATPHGAVFQLHAPDTNLTLGSLLVTHSHKSTCKTWSRSQAAHRDGRWNKDNVHTLMTPQPLADLIDPWFPFHLPPPHPPPPPYC